MKSLCPLWPSQRDNLDLVGLCSWLTFPFFVLYNLVYPTAMTLKSPELGALFSSLLLLEGEPGFCEREIRTGRDSGPFSVRREVADGELLCLIKKSPDKATGMPERTGFPTITEPWSFCCEMVFLACSCGSEGTAPAVWLPAPPSLWNSILRVLSKAWVWRSFRNIYLHFFTLASANSGRWALSQKGLHCFFLLAVCSTAPSCLKQRIWCCKDKPTTQGAFHCARAQWWGNHLVPKDIPMGVTSEMRAGCWIWLQILWKAGAVAEGQLGCVCRSLCCWRPPRVDFCACFCVYKGAHYPSQSTGSFQCCCSCALAAHYRAPMAELSTSITLTLEPTPLQGPVESPRLV